MGLTSAIVQSEAVSDSILRVIDANDKKCACTTLQSDLHLHVHFAAKSGILQLQTRSCHVDEASHIQNAALVAHEDIVKPPKRDHKFMSSPYNLREAQLPSYLLNAGPRVCRSLHFSSSSFACSPLVRTEADIYGVVLDIRQAIK